jgi:hypothetical protein
MAMKYGILVRYAFLMLLAGVASASDRIRIVDEGGIRDEWTMAPGAKLAVAGYPAAYAEQPVEVCVAIGYLLNPDGTTSDFALLKSWSGQEPRHGRNEFWQAFAGAASQALAQWHFVPRAEIVKPRPVYTVATFVFGSTAPTETRKRCTIPDVPMRLLELRNDTRANRIMSGGIYDRLEIDPAFEDRYRQMLRNHDNSRPDYGQPPPPQPPPPPPPPPSQG